MNQGTVIANVGYEVPQSSEYRKIGALYYYRNHKGGTPDAQLRLDVMPSVAWENNPECWFVGNFIPTEKIPDAPYICGRLFVPSDKRGDRTYIGQVISDESEDGSKQQYRMKLFGIPLREISKGIKARLKEDSSTKHNSVYIGIELDG